jgi:hypothetical protein
VARAAFHARSNVDVDSLRLTTAALVAPLEDQSYAAFAPLAEAFYRSVKAGGRGLRERASAEDGLELWRSHRQLRVWSQGGTWQPLTGVVPGGAAGGFWYAALALTGERMALIPQGVIWPDAESLSTTEASMMAARKVAVRR